MTMPFDCTKAELEKYAKAADTKVVLGSILDNPLHLMLFLSAATEPAMLMLLSKVNCPVDPVGSVNTRNRFEILDPKGLKSALEQHVKGIGNEKMVVMARLGDGVKQVKRGWDVTLVVDLLLGDKAIYRQSFTFLQFYKHQTPPTPVTQPPEAKKTSSSQSTAIITSADPGLWASLSKDYNPIHFVSALAKISGFRSKIAHGNQVLAKAISSLSNSVGTAKVTWLEVEFKRPVFVSSTLDISESRDKAGSVIEVGSEGKVHVIARYKA